MSNFNAKAARGKRPCPIWVDAFQRDTQHLEADEIGAYLLILMAMWTRESCDFPDDDSRLARVSRVSVRLWKSRIGPVIRSFLTAESGVVFSKKLREEAAYTERQVKQQSDRKAGDKSCKSLKNKDVTLSADTSADTPRIHPTQLPNYPTVSKKGRSYDLLSPGDDDFAPVEADNESDQISASFDAYNEAAEKGGWPKVQVRTKARVAALRGRLKDAGGIEGWRVALEKALASSHCCGKNDRGWTADFDFLTRQSSFAKLMEGSYNDRPGYSKAVANADALRDAIHVAASNRRSQKPDFF